VIRRQARSGTLALRVERQSARKSKTKNGRLTSLAPNTLVTVPILEVWAKWVKYDARTTSQQLDLYAFYDGSGEQKKTVNSPTIISLSYFS